MLGLVSWSQRLGALLDGDPAQLPVVAPAGSPGDLLLHAILGLVALSRTVQRFAPDLPPSSPAGTAASHPPPELRELLR